MKRPDNRGIDAAQKTEQSRNMQISPMNIVQMNQVRLKCLNIADECTGFQQTAVPFAIQQLTNCAMDFPIQLAAGTIRIRRRFCRWLF